MRVVTLLACRHPSPLGTLVLLGRRSGLMRLDLPGHLNDERLTWARRWEGEAVRIVWKESAHTGWRRGLDRYFSGKKVIWDGLLDLRGTGFQQRVWRALLDLGYGETLSYGALTKRLGEGHPRAIGQAVHRNPLSIIVPCHRVIGSDGSLVGYGGGLPVKRFLLALENALPNPGLFDNLPPKAPRRP